MATKSKHNAPIASPGRRRLLGWGVIAGALLGLAGATALPFYFESASILYKFGWERLILLAAHAMGVAAGYLLLIQVLLAARLKVLDRLFGLDVLFKIHRACGIAIATTVLLHPVLIFLSDDRLFIPFQLRYWPEFVGLLVWVLLVATAVFSCWRARFRIAFHRWWFFHRNAAVLIFAAFWIHLYFVNETFRHGVPLAIFWGGLGLGALAMIWSRTRFLRLQRNPFSVSVVEHAGKDTVRLKIESPSGNPPAYLPGQFGFITPLSSALAQEEHPFTIASTPSRPEALEFIIRAGGDWTGQLDRLQPGDKVLLDGPFGRFSYLLHPAADEIVLIAGGIGITPMLSMLRHLADRKDHRRIKLIWSNRSRDRLDLDRELSRLQSRLKGLDIHRIFTGESDVGDADRRLNRSKLEALLNDCSPNARIYVCGPDRMIVDMVRHLIALGTPKRLIHSERFSL
jgi:predicted ferric reductase